ncbi:hypothetical protein D5S18_19895 [Nocardia panacis]|uniref:Aminoglycoside phosphotransferase domain-containing protein n=1 Tax=Nocardia panacis TaxID=2340916 RepID=A0A3A4K195_9NOCA|nr:phosphotransferase [Nocardia panacis]RJO73480.1 hypothetical protein D5S18_19895 [Nocardia panacis]
MDMSASVELPVDWDVSVRAALAESPRPELADGSLQPLGAGMDSVALLLEHAGVGHVLRLPQSLDGADGIAREARLLPELALRLPLPIPGFLFTAPNPLGPGRFCVYPAVPGDSLSVAEWERRGIARTPDAVRVLAELIDALHGFPVDRARELGIETADPRGDFAEDLDAVRAEVIPLLPAPEARALLAAWEGYLADDANFAYRPTLLHSDISLDHLLVTDTRITGLIDFGDTEIGDPAYDLAYLYPEAGPAFVRRVQQARGADLDPGLERKLRFWACADPARDVLHGIENDLPDFGAERLAVLTDTIRRFHL